MLAMGDALTNCTQTQSKAQLTCSQWDVPSLIVHWYKARLTSHARNGRCTHKLHVKHFVEDTKQGSTYMLTMGVALTNCMKDILSKIQSKAQLTWSQWEVHSQIACKIFCRRYKARLNSHAHNGRCTYILHWKYFVEDTKQGSIHTLAMEGAFTNCTQTPSKAHLPRSQWEVHSLIVHGYKARLNSYARNRRCTHKLHGRHFVEDT